MNLVVKVSFLYLSFSLLSTAVDGQNRTCHLDRLSDCPITEVCVQLNTTSGHCVCRQDYVRVGGECVGTNTTEAPTTTTDGLRVDTSYNPLTVIFSVFVSLLVSLVIVASVYYWGIRRGVFREIWARAFPLRNFDHQLLDRNNIVQNDDTEVIT